METKIYRTFPFNEGNKLIDWAEEHDIDWHIGNDMGEDLYKMELWLEKFPTDEEMLILFKKKENQG